MSAQSFHPYRTGPDTLDAIRADLDTLLSDCPAPVRSVDKVGMSDAVPSFPNSLEVAADAARALYLRRQLAQAAEHGAALLASFGLPRLVDADFVPLDPAAIGEALDHAIAALDALDGDPDAEDGGDDEPSLGWEKPGSQSTLTEGAFSGDRELDTADHETTALERHGRGFFRSGPDDAEDSDPAERDDEHGSEDAEDIGHHASQHAPRPLRAVDHEAVAIMAARAAQARRTLHV